MTNDDRIVFKDLRLSVFKVVFTKSTKGHVFKAYMQLIKIPKRINIGRSLLASACAFSSKGCEYL